ncbi:unnamed protein product, partial [Symbiodinium sp. CCMP2456]
VGGGTADRQRQRQGQMAASPKQRQLSFRRGELGRRMGPGSPARSSAPVSAAKPPVEPGQGLGPGRSGGAASGSGDGEEALLLVSVNEQVDDEARRSVVHQPGAGQLRHVCPDSGSVIGRPGALQGDRGLAPDEEGPAGAAHPSPQDLDAEALGGLDADKDGSCDAVRALHPAGEGNARPGRVLQRSIPGMGCLSTPVAGETGQGPHDPLPGPRALETDAGPSLA